MNKNDLKRLSPVKVRTLVSSFLRKIFKGPIMAAGGFDRAGAEDILQRGDERAYTDSLPRLPAVLPPERQRPATPVSPGSCARRST